MSKFSRGEGFTLIEVLVVIALGVILATFSLLLGTNFYTSYSFRSDRDILVSALEKARNRSLANINQAPHGVHIDPAQYVIFEGATYATRDATKDESIPASAAIIRTVSVPQPEFVFLQLDGGVAIPGNITLATAGHSPATITINSEGQIDW